MTQTSAAIEPLYKARKGRVDIIDVPELPYLVVPGQGPPDDPSFAEAVKALYTVSYEAHFLVKKSRGYAGKVMPLEALWWVDDPRQQDLITAVALGNASMQDADRDKWRWQAMLMQPQPVDEKVIAEALDEAAKKSLPVVSSLRFDRWQEGLCAQLLHVGPYADEASDIVMLHEAIKHAGYRPKGRHHEIYIGDPRRAAPDKLRTILRHPVVPA